jgi:Zn-dependent protease
VSPDGQIFLLSAPFLILSLMVHELAHGWTALLFGDPTARMMGRLSPNPIRHLDPLGTAALPVTYALSVLTVGANFGFGWARPVPVIEEYFRSRRRGMAFVSVAGPAASLLLAYGAELVLVHGGLEGRALRVVALVVGMNLSIALFNLLPIPGLDGSRLVGALLDDERAARWGLLDRYGILIVVVVVLVATGPASGGVSTVLVDTAGALRTLAGG